MGSGTLQSEVTRSAPAAMDVAEGAQPGPRRTLREAVARRGSVVLVWSLTGLLVGSLLHLATPTIYRTRTAISFPVDQKKNTSADGVTRLQSPALAPAVSSRLFADRHPESVDATDPLSTILRLVHRGGRQPLPYTALVADTARRTRVDAQGLLGRAAITCESLDPTLAGAYCNTLAQTFVEEEGRVVAKGVGAEDDRSTRAAANLRQRADDLRQQLRVAEQENENAAGSALDPTLEGSLAAIRQGLVKAQMDRVRQEAQMGGTAQEISDYESARHREELLLLTYNAKVASLSPASRRAARVILLRREVESLEALDQTLSTRAEAAPAATPAAQVIEPAAPARPSTPHRQLEAMAGLVLGSLCGVGLSLYQDRRFTLLRAPGDAWRQLGMTELGVVPAAAHGQEADTIIEATYQRIAYSMLMEDWGAGVRSYVVTSADGGEGRSMVAVNLARALGKSTLRVVLVDGDLRQPCLHEDFGLDNDFGLRDLVRGEVDLAAVPISVLARATAAENVSLVSSGQATDDAAEWMRSARWALLFDRLKREFDMVVIDAPPLLRGTDTGVFAQRGDAAVLVLCAGETSRENAATTINLLHEEGVRIVGTILYGYPVSSRESPAQPLV